MTIGVIANNERWEELKKQSNEIAWIKIDPGMDIPIEADAFIILDQADQSVLLSGTKPILVNEVETTLKEMSSGSNVIRFNGWPGFLNHSTWEVAGTVNETVEQIFTALKKAYCLLPDEPGFITARIIAMIINEAYFALGENVSTKEEIDIAMKLGTNYPFGPFEWAALIGKQNIFTLLRQLSKTDKRYLPAPLLQLEAAS